VRREGDIRSAAHSRRCGADGVLVYFNEAGATVVTVTIVGLDGGAVALSGGNLVWTA
jgi:hypothetical protein